MVKGLPLVTLGGPSKYYTVENYEKRGNVLLGEDNFRKQFPELKKKKGLSVSLCNYRQPPSATTMAKILTMLLTVVAVDDDDVVVCGAAQGGEDDDRRRNGEHAPFPRTGIAHWLTVSSVGEFTSPSPSSSSAGGRLCTVGG